MLPLDREAADDLVLAAVSAPFAVTDLTAAVPATIAALDASPDWGAVCDATLPQALANDLYDSSFSRGGYTRLNAPRSSLAVVGADGAENDDDECDAALLGPPPARELAMHYDFLSVCGGAGKVNKRVAALGGRVGPVLDKARDPQFDLCDNRFVEWLVWLLFEERLDGVGMEPPCRTYSIAARFSHRRSHQFPRGVAPLPASTLEGNEMMFRTLLLLYIVILVGACGYVEQPWTSKARRLVEWTRALARGAREVRTASCAFAGNVATAIQKEFVFLVFGMKTFEAKVGRRCPGTHAHQMITGKSMGVASATYVDGLADGLGSSALAGAREVRRRRDADAPRPVSGAARAFITELMLSTRFAEVRRWKWKAPGHINVLEASVVRNWLLGVLPAGVVRSSRPFALVDSEVSRLSVTKGRSSSYTLTPVLQQSAVVQLGGGLYPRFAHTPSKLNVADDPTRHEEVRPPAREPPAWWHDGEVTAALLRLPAVRRPVAAWTRLVCCLLGAELGGLIGRRGEGRSPTCGW